MPASPCHLPFQLRPPGVRTSLPAEVGRGRGGAHSSALRDCRAGLQGGRGRCLPRSYKGSHQRWRPLLAAPAASRHACPPDSAAACPAMGRQKELVSRCGEMLHIRYRLLRQALAECLGTLILVVSGGSRENLSLSSPCTPQTLTSPKGLCFPRWPGRTSPALTPTLNPGGSS